MQGMQRSGLKRNRSCRQAADGAVFCFLSVGWLSHHLKVYCHGGAYDESAGEVEGCGREVEPGGKELVCEVWSNSRHGTGG